MKRWIFTLVFAPAALACTLVACQPAKEQKASSERQAPADARKSFAVKEADKSHVIRLKKDSLDKVFLLLPSMKTTGEMPQWADFAPVAVVFQKSGSSLGLFELQTSVYDAIKAENLLGTFKIIEETEQDIAFEWSVGLNSLPMRSHYVNPFESRQAKQLDSQGLVNGITVKDSFVRKAALENNELRIEQVSRVQSPALIELEMKTKKPKKQQSLLTTETTYVMDLHIRPYVSSKAFQKRAQEPRRLVDFFAVKTLDDKKAEPVQLAVHWDVSADREPIGVILSKETPAEYRETVKEGALYWNRVYGREVLRVIENGSADTPVDRAIVIRWIPWDDAGFAYASMQSDPFTGEVLRAQVFMTSSFVNERGGSRGEDYGSVRKIPLGLPTTHLCELSPRDIGAGKHSHLSDAASSARNHDMVRLVIAHELGHTMGLRHNFAGSIGAEASTEEIAAQTAAYKNDPSHPGVAVTSSVMDYLQSVHFSAIGRWIKGHELPYDKIAIDYLETGKIADKVPPFCSDDEIMAAQLGELSLYDCSQQDWGPNPIQARSLTVRGLFRTKIAQTLDMALVGMFPKDLRKKEPKKFEDAVKALETESFSISAYDAPFLRGVLLLTEKNGKTVDKLVSLAAMKKITPDFDPYSDEVSVSSDPLVLEKIKTDLAAAGGLVKIIKNAIHFNDAGTFDEDWAAKDLAAVLAGYPLKSGLTMEGVSYSLADDQVAQMSAALKKAVDANSLNYVATAAAQFLPGTGYDYNNETKALENTISRLRGNLLSPEDADQVAGLAAQLILMSNKALPISSAPNAPSVAVATLSSGGRASLAAVFDSNLWGGGGVNSAIKAKVRDELVKRLNIVGSLAPSAGTTPQETDYEKLKMRVSEAFATGKLTSDAWSAALGELTVLEKLK